LEIVDKMKSVDEKGVVSPHPKKKPGKSRLRGTTASF
jgi:hypothetical protein